MRRALLPLLSIVGLLIPGVAGAQKVPIGPQFQVNTYTTSDQGRQAGGCGYWDGRGQAVAEDAAGNFVVVWSDGPPYSGDGQDGSRRGIFGQRYDTSGLPVSGEFQVNTYTTGDQRYPRVAMDSAGNFVVVWNGEFNDNGGFDNNVRGQRFDSAGTPQGVEFEVTANCGTYCSGGNYTPRYPAVGTDGAGRFIVVWDEQDGYYGRRISGRRYDSGGAPLGSQFQVSQALYPYGRDYETAAPDVRANTDGSFVVVWHSFGYDYYDGSGYTILGRRFDSAGDPQGDQFEIQPPACFETFPRIAGDDAGTFVVVWRSTSLGCGYAYDDGNIAARRYDSTGSPIDETFRVNTYTTGIQRCAAVAAAPDGRFVVTWHDTYQGMGFGKQFDNTGAPVGGDFLLNIDASQNHVAGSTSVAMDAGGNFVVVWVDHSGYSQLELDGDGLGVFGQRFGDPGSFTPTCWPTPRPNCRQQTKARGAFRFRKNPTNPARSSLAWRWPRGESTSNAEFGDVFTDVSYALCVYDGSPNPQPLVSAVLPPGGTCGPAAIPCWRELTGFGPPLFYLDGNRTQGGIVQLRLKPGATDNTRITTRARGENLTLPATPLTAPVTVQLQGSHGECFTATYAQRIRKNEGGVFRARPGSPSAAFLDAGAAVLD